MLLKVAWPLLSGLVASVVVPSLNVTVPVGVPLPLTVAVKVTCWPNVDGFDDDVSVVVVLLLFTVCVTAADVLDSKLESPL